MRNSAADNSGVTLSESSGRSGRGLKLCWQTVVPVAYYQQSNRAFAGFQLEPIAVQYRICPLSLSCPAPAVQEEGKGNMFPSVSPAEFISAPHGAPANIPAGASGAADRMEGAVPTHGVFPEFTGLADDQIIHRGLAPPAAHDLSFTPEREAGDREPFTRCFPLPRLISLPVKLRHDLSTPRSERYRTGADIAEA
jgi:hypothetical protein